MPRSITRLALGIVLTLVIELALMSDVAWALNILWDGTTGATWNSRTPWSLLTNATTPDPNAKPGATDIAHFNITTANTPQTVNLDAAQSALGLAFDSTGTVLIESAIGGSGTNALTLGTSGITINAGAGADTISSAISLAGAESWTNNSSNLFTVSGNITNGANLLTIAGTGNTTISGSLGTGNGGLTKSGAGILSLNNNNTFAGGVTINAGTLSLGNNGALNSATPNVVAFGAGSTGTLSLSGNNLTVSGLSTNATVGTPVVQNSSSALSATLTVNNANDNTYAGALQDGGAVHLALTKAGAGTLALTGNSSYNGNTIVGGGTLQLAGTGGNQLSNRTTVIVNSGGSFDLNGRSEVIASLQLDGYGIGNQGALLNSANGDSVLSLPLLTNPTISILLGTSIGVTQSGGSLTISDHIVSNGAIEKVGAGTLILTGDNNLFMGAFYNIAGTLAIGNNVALGTSQLVLEGGAIRSEGGAHTVNNSVNLLTPGIVTGSEDLTLTGTVRGPGRLTKEGTGTLTLSGANIYTGDTIVSGGALSVNGSIPGAVTVNDGATLQGSGMVDGLVTVASGGDFSPGNSPGAITVGSLALNNGAHTHIELGGTDRGTKFDAVIASGLASLGGTLQVSLINNFMPAPNDSFDILDASSITGQFATLDLPMLGGSLAWNTSQLYTSGVIRVVNATMLGDYNNDGDVNAADFVLWRHTLGQLVGQFTGADGNGNGAIDNGDYDLWRAHFGQTAGSGVGATTNAVPEPATLVLLMFVAVAGCCIRRRRIA